jgi:hypothetical protein
LVRLALKFYHFQGYDEDEDQLEEEEEEEHKEETGEKGTMTKTISNCQYCRRFSTEEKAKNQDENMH